MNIETNNETPTRYKNNSRNSSNMNIVSRINLVVT